MAFNFSPKIVTNGLVLYLDAANTRSYPGSGTTWADISRNANNMTWISTPAYDTLYNGSFIFNGSTNYGNLSTENQITTSQITTEIVCSVTSNTATGTGGNTGGSYIYFRQNTRTTFFEGYVLAYYIGSGTNPGSIAAVAASVTGTQPLASFQIPGFNIPMIISARYNSTSIDIFYNGVLMMSTATGFALNFNTNHRLTIGRANPTGSTFDRYFNGRIFSYKQYNRSLSNIEILQNYNATKTRFGLT